MRHAIVIPFVSLLLAAPALAAPQAVLPVGPPTFYPLSNPGSIATGDVDGDGHLDVVAIGGFSAFSISVMLGNGAGLLGPASSFSFGGFPARFALADLNLDGKLDVVTTRTSFMGLSNGVAWRLSAPGVGLGFLMEIPLSDWPEGIAVGDVSGDGIPDVIVSAGISTASELIALVGDGSGGLPQFLPLPIPSTFGQIRLADLNGDGALDACAVTDGAGTFDVAMGSSIVPYFNPPTSTPLGTSGVDLALDDVDGDGAIDALVAAKQPPACLVFAGNGSGGFSQAHSFPFGPDVASMAH